VRPLLPRAVLTRPGRLAATTAAVLAAGLLAAAAPAEPAAGAPVEAATTPVLSAVAAPDFATDRWGDAWDFSNPDDLLLDEGPTMGLEAPAIRDGYLSFGMSGLGYFSPLWGGYPGALFLGREGRAPQNRIDAGRYTRLSFSAWADRDTEAGVFWFGGADGSTMGGQPLRLARGWHTYDLELENRDYGLAQPWSGSLSGLRFALSPSAPTRFSFDWMRLYAPAATIPVPPGTLWDVDDDPSDNTADRPGWGRVPGGDLGFLPPGTYWLVQDGRHTGPVHLRRHAAPVVLDPDEVGGAAYGGRPWTFADPSGVSEIGHASVLGWGDRLTARNSTNDPFVWLRLHAGHVDSTRYHRLTVRSGYEGPFDLRDTAGGGSMARVVWRAADNPGFVQQTNDIVTYSGTRTVTVDLHAPDVHEPDAPPIRAWDAAPVSGLRWDPNEDHGPRTWWLDRVALRADDEAGTSYDVRWYDAGYAPGSTATLYRQDDAAGTNRRVLAGATALPQRAGTNVFRWDSSATPPGRYWIAVEVTGPGGTASSVSSGPVRVVGGLAGQAPSPAAPLSRDLADACPQSRVPGAGFADVPAGSVHGSAVDCLAWWGITRPAGGYDPGGTVTRGQMATFLARVVASAGGELPAGQQRFADVVGHTHAPAVEALAVTGVVGGYPDGTYRPDEPVNRAQMATFLVRAAEHVSGRGLVRPADHFDDDTASPHRDAIDKAAGAGIAGGTAEGRYSPLRSVRRDQMASFLVRLVDLLVSDGHGAPPAR
jgi:hypothetical protein